MNPKKYFSFHSRAPQRNSCTCFPQGLLCCRFLAGRYYRYLDFDFRNLSPNTVHILTRVLSGQGGGGYSVGGGLYHSVKVAHY